MTRKEIYQYIKSNPEFKVYMRDVMGVCNYTQESNAMLENYIKIYEQEHFIKSDSSPLKYVISKNCLNKLIEVLEKKRILLKSEVDYIKA